jgi:heme/copper-type cytochrome/quinol oxidase subunit 2
MPTRVLIVGGFLLLALLVGFVPWPAATPAGGEREVLVRARQYAYVPGVVRVTRGDRVTLVLEAEDVTHALRVDGYGEEVVAVPGQRARITFVADRSGRFQMRCSKVCGTLHPFMLGELIVEPQRGFWRSAAVAGLAALATVLWVTIGRRDGTRESAA